MSEKPSSLDIKLTKQIQVDLMPGTSNEAPGCIYAVTIILLLMFILSFPNIIFFFNDLKVSNLSNKNITLALKNEIFASKFSIIPQFKYFMNMC